MTKGPFILILPLLFLAVASSPVVADAVYTYTGHNFDTAVGAYITLDKVTGTFTVANPLPANLSSSDISADVLSYSFSDGVQTLTEANSAIVSFLVTTGPSGVLSEWSITVWETPITDMVGGTVRGIDANFNTGFTNDFGFTGGSCLDVMGGVCVSADAPGGDYGRIAGGIPEIAGFFGQETLDETVQIPVLDGWGLALLALGLLVWEFASGFGSDEGSEQQAPDGHQKAAAAEQSWPTAKLPSVGGS